MSMTKSSNIYEQIAEEYLQDELFLMADRMEQEQYLLEKYSRPVPIGRRVFSRKFNFRNSNREKRIKLHQQLPF